jgi:lipoate-protein ligase A
MEAWQLIQSPRLAGSANMQFDLKIFNDFEKGQAASTLRIYSWKPSCISLGYSQKIEEEIDLDKASKLGWDVVKRPTGGGIVFHNEAEVTYSLVTGIDNPMLPEGLVPSYKKISEAIVWGLSTLGIEAGVRKQELESRTQSAGLCFSYPAEYEIVVANRKIVGSAQKRGKKALLQQGSIFVKESDDKMFSILKKSYGEQNAVSVESILGRQVSFEELNIALINGFEKMLGIQFKT